MKRDLLLSICGQAYQRFSRGISLDDDELQFLRKELRRTVELISSFSDRSFQLFLIKLESDLVVLDSYSKERRTKYVGKK